MPSKLVASDGRVAVDERVIEQPLHRPRLELDDRRLRSWMFVRVDCRKLSMSASPPRILSAAVACVNVGVLSSQASPTS